MLWYRGWLETRARVFVALLWMILLLTGVHTLAARPPGPGVQRAETLAILANTFMVVVFAIFAGAGIRTQAPFRAQKGLYGSTLFTLSLPVSRFRLIAIRAGLGWLELAGLTAAYCLASWFLFPLNGLATPVEMIEHVATLIACFSSLYFFAVLLATILEEPWSIWGGMLAWIALWLISTYAHPPHLLDIYWAIGLGSPIVAHAIPRAPIALSVALAAVLSFAALKIAERREY